MPSIFAFLSSGVLGFWTLIFIANYLLRRSKLRGVYERFLGLCGITVALGHVKIFTVGLNRFFARCAKVCPRWQKRWFCMGAMFGVFSMFASVVVLILTILTVFTSEKNNEDQPQKLVVVLPGVNMPTSQIVYMVLALLVSAILHEAGHAVCALGEGVKLNGFGLFLMIIYPGAYVDLDTESLLNKFPLQQLRIYCAGVWHNFVILMFTYSLMVYLPLILTPFYTSGQGVLVKGVDASSPLYSPVTFPVGTVITDINKCPVMDVDSYGACLRSIYNWKSSGFCVDLHTIEQLKSAYQLKNLSLQKTPVECCSSEGPGDLCFQFDSHSWTVSEEDFLFGDLGTQTKTAKSSNYRCLNARKIVDSFECAENRDCYLFYGESSRCLFPSQANQSRLLRVSHSHGDDLLYIGDLFVFSYALTVGNFVPVFSFLPESLPDVMMNVLKYLSSFSAALALLNAVPCYTLDGQWIFSGVMEALAVIFGLDQSDKESIKVVVLSFGTLLLVANIVVAFVNSFSQFYF